MIRPVNKRDTREERATRVASGCDLRRGAACSRPDRPSRRNLPARVRGEWRAPVGVGEGG
ncbi:hypothetical protein E2562_009350 [Oryza meyeriana var. granulata]|uniref:Uncharacterized protein n=1 Tax=Oryza meyeriana var. granulata TaxID=110450 RepID=A0A6G1CDP9_9ORYZ|nr:hypothetical protein E2562_009350 [Oryza meyeriana var. granulata]